MPRNSSGTYSLYTPGNPVVPTTVITTTWANNTLSDIATALTDSLSRSGNGGMTASLGLAAGVIGAPGLSWTAETTSGLYRASAGNFRYSVGGADVLTITNAGLAITGTLSATGAITGSNFTGMASPSATIGLSAVLGVATTAMRSDGAPALSQAIVPTWTGLHTFGAGSGIEVANSDPLLYLSDTAQAADAKRWLWNANGTLDLYAVNDAKSTFKSALSIGRTAAAVASLSFGNATDNPTFSFLGSGAMAIGGSVSVTGARVDITNSFARLFLNDSSGAANNVKSRVVNNAGELSLQFMNDAESTAATAFAATRSGATVTNVALGNTTDNPSYTFRGTGQITTGGPLSIAIGAATQAAVWNSTNANGPYMTFARNGTGFADIGDGKNIGGTFTQDSLGLGARAGFAIEMSANGTTSPHFRIDTAGATNIWDGSTLQPAGFRNIPRSTTATTLVIADRGKVVAVSANIAIPASIFAAGDALSVYNDSAASVSLTIAAGTLRLGGTTTTGARTIAPRGMATIWFNVGGATPEVIATGPGVT